MFERYGVCASSRADECPGRLSKTGAPEEARGARYTARARSLGHEIRIVTILQRKGWLRAAPAHGGSTMVRSARAGHGLDRRVLYQPRRMVDSHTSQPRDCSEARNTSSEPRWLAAATDPGATPGDSDSSLSTHMAIERRLGIDLG